MQIPTWLAGTTDAQGVERIRQSVFDAEKRTSAEIVPMIVERSTTIGHVFPILVLLNTLIFWSVAPLVASRSELPIWALEFAGFVLALGLSYVMKGFAFWQRGLTSDDDLQTSVFRRAQLEFMQMEIHQTQGRNGVLIMVSLLERRAVVLADLAITREFPENVWETLITDLIAGVQRGDFAGGMCAAIDDAAKLLANKFPIRSDDRNELEDRLVIKS